MSNINNQFNDSNFYNATFNYGDKKIKKFLGSTPAFLEEENFKGRKQDLLDLEQRLFEDRNVLLLVNGHGGIGKTTLAAKYYEKHQEHYKHLAWLTAEASILDALLILGNPQNLNCKFSQHADQEERLATVLQELRNLAERCLLVLDNADKLQDLKEHYDKLRTIPNFHILLTTRVQNFQQAHIFRVEALSEEEAMEVFKKYYKGFQEKETQLFKELYKVINGNTLVIELLAKNLEEINQDEEFYSLESLLIDLQKKGLFGLSDEEAVKVDYRNLKETEPSEVIALMYDFDKPNPLSEDEKQLLSNLTVLPSENISFDILKTLLNPENPRELSKTLTALHRKGWLEKSKLNQESFYKISPVIQDITIERNQERLLEDCTALIESLTRFFEENYIKEENYLNFKWGFYANRLYKFLGNNQKLSNLNNYLAMTLRSLGGEQNLLKAKELLEKVIKNDISCYGNNSPTVSLRRSDLSLVLWDLGGEQNLLKAKELLDDSLNSDIFHFGETSEKVIVRQTNLGLVLIDIGGEENFLKAKELFESALTNSDNINNIVRVSRIQTNLATIFKKIGGEENLIQAKFLLEKALKNSVLYYGRNSPNIATIQSNLALVLQDIGGKENFLKAKELLEIALYSDINHFGETHPNVATHQSNLAIVLMDLGGKLNLNLAKEYLVNSFYIIENKFSTNHPNFQKALNNLSALYILMKTGKQLKDVTKEEIKQLVPHFWDWVNQEGL